MNQPLERKIDDGPPPGHGAAVVLPIVGHYLLPTGIPQPSDLECTFQIRSPDGL